ncbi:MAG: enoyl-CoA hydratase/isomerase family protein, partial [Gammaproteobacteria bacterium]|nr:enoyl-CoA hydratase/isomerase family protein [Gammaproteobacteria bacterium]
LHLTINRPEKRNALNLRLLDEIGDAFAAHAEHPEIKLALLTGAGEKAFAAGGDLKELNTVRSEEDSFAMSRRGRRALDQIRYFPLPVVAAINGLALGGGAELCLACDLRIAAIHAEIGLIQSRLNVTTAWGGGIDLLDLVGHSRALQMLITAQRLGAAEALQLGIINAIADADFAASVDNFIAPYLVHNQQVIRGYKMTTLAHRKCLHDKLGATEEQQFVKTWVHDDHWAAAEKALKR